jgi:hypothetical protein
MVVASQTFTLASYLHRFIFSCICCFPYFLHCPSVWLGKTSSAESRWLLVNVANFFGGVSLNTCRESFLSGWASSSKKKKNKKNTRDLFLAKQTCKILRALLRGRLTMCALLPGDRTLYHYWGPLALVVWNGWLVSLGGRAAATLADHEVVWHVQYVA